MPTIDAMALDLPPHYHDLTFMTPLSEERAARLVAFIAENLTGTVIDIGCGWAELLLRVLEAAPSVHGTGFELDEGALAHAWTLANARGLADRVSFIAGDAHTPPVFCHCNHVYWGKSDLGTTG